MPETATIHSEQRIPLPIGGGRLQEFIAIVYSTPTVPPRTVYVDPDHDSPQERIAKIEADIKAYKETPPAQLKLS